MAGAFGLRSASEDTRMLRSPYLSALVVLAVTTCSGTRTRTATATRTFGPVVPHDAPIAGRVVRAPGHVLLMVPEAGLIDVDLTLRHATRHPVPQDLARACWGLASLTDGSLWTLKNMYTLARLDQAGSVLEELALSAPHLGVFSHGDRLLYMRAAQQPSQPVLEVGPPGEKHRQPWSALRARTLNLSKGAAAALNMVACGVTRTAEQPCWFPEETTLSMISTDGATRRLDLAGLDRVAPEVLLTAARAARPIRDAFVDDSGAVWVIGSGRPEPGVDLQGGWLLGKYDTTGRAVFLDRLPGPARLILHAGGDRALLLGGDGYVVEAHP
jgi:hypothetical protein